MRNLAAVFLVTALMSLLTALPAFGWGEEGHRIVAGIGDRRGQGGVGPAEIGQQAIGAPARSQDADVQRARRQQRGQRLAIVFM